VSPSPEHRRAAIEEAARVVRENIEAFAIHASKVHKAKIITLTTTAGEMNLCGACAIASIVLWRALRAAGFRDTSVVRGWYFGSNHCWVEVEGLLVDVTATQFGATRAVVFEPVEHARIHGYELFKGPYSADRDEAALRSTSTWCEGQSPCEPKYQEDLGIIEGLALDAALAEFTVDELDTDAELE
jgi:hypothetical protein